MVVVSSVIEGFAEYRQTVRAGIDQVVEEEFEDASARQLPAPLLLRDGTQTA
jgi:hypothetical protein